MSLINLQEEYLKCATDPIYYLNTYGYVFDARKQHVEKMTCFEYQEDCIFKFHKYRNNAVLKSRQCLPEETLVDTPQCKKKIKNFKKGDELYSFNFESNKVEVDYIKDVWCSGEKECVKIVTYDGKEVESGEIHPFYIINKGWVSAKQLKDGDAILNKENKQSIVKKVIKTGKKICYDLEVKKNESFFVDDLLVHNTGLSVITAGYVAWRLIFRKDEKILIIANDGDGAMRFLGTVKQFINYTPNWLKPGDGLSLVDNQKYIKLKNNSYAQAKASSPEAGRGDSLTLLVLDETAFIENADTIWMAAGLALSQTQGKCIMISCVPEDTYVFTNKGLKQVKDFVPSSIEGAHEVDQYSVLGKDKTRTSNLFFNNGIHDTKKIITTNSFLEGTFNHKVWAYKDEKFDWVKLSELNQGDYISIQYGNELWAENDAIQGFDSQDSTKCLNKFNPSKITKKIAYFLGLFIAEGSAYKKFKENKFIGGKVTITCGDDVSKVIEDIGLTYYLSKDGLHYEIGSKQLVLFLEHLGFDLSKKAKQKEIPSRLFEMSRENIVYLLKGIFDGDGFSRKDREYVGICLSSQKLINQIRMLLINFGILTDYCEVWTKPTKKVKVSSLGYRLSCSGNNSKLFYEKIGFGFKRKMDNENVLKGYCDFSIIDRNDVIPNGTSLLKKMVKESEYNTYSLRKQFKININGQLNSKKKDTDNISRTLLLKVFEAVKHNLSLETIEYYERILSSNLKWNKINKIEYSKKPTYDFSLPEKDDDFWCHSVLYNGVLGHQTPNGTSNLYHSVWTEADKKSNNFAADDFIPTRVHWVQNPYCSEGLELKMDDSGEKVYWSPWYESECKRMHFDRVKIAQELDLSFEGSKHLAIENEIISKYEKRLLLDEYKLIDKNKTYYDYKNEPGERFVTYETNFWVFKKYVPGHKYLLGGDVARGDGTDFSTIQVIDIDTLEVVAEYRDKIAPDLFAHVIYNVAMDYGEAYVVVECNSFGLATAIDLNRKMNYTRMYFSKNIKEIYVRPYDYKIDENEIIPGFQTTSRTRPLVINNLRIHLREGSLKIYSKRLMSEFRTFVQKGERPEAEKGKNDDLIFALAIGLFIRDTEYQNAAESKEMYKGMLDAIGYCSQSIAGQSFSTNPSGEEISDIPPDAGGIFFNSFSKDKKDDGDDFNDLGWLLS